MYRATQPSDEGYDTPQEEFNAMREFAQNALTTSDPHDVMDTLLMLANVCEMRTLLDPLHKEWWDNAAQCMRAILMMLNTPTACPNAKLENPMLYFPDVKDIV